ncbi:peroxiredoxin [Nitrospira sp. KM1]|uniref:hypothetical protein n=1 Tax=Nitrospira sp. KM1 TaxID=1936990 RepID=UPI0013A77C1B|nr:hypothetical protein [Nitrospira sp. KM1]BCA56635.1 peroxiredoxin [Nitrospira sp. KM1]
MKQNGSYVLNFRGPALVGQQLTFVHGKQFEGRTMALCFLPYAGLIAPDKADHASEQFEFVGTTLVIVVSGAYPMHRLWSPHSEKPRTTILADPCGRLHRSFGVMDSQPSSRCRTFLIDREGILRLRVTHDFIEQDLEAIRTIAGLSHHPSLRGNGTTEPACNVHMEYLPV